MGMVDHVPLDGYHHTMKKDRKKTLLLFALFALWCAVLFFRPVLYPGAS
jgi:hypothetical protein